MKTLAFATATVLGFAVLVPHIHADEFDNKTTIRVNETILIPGRTLTPGTYVMKLMPSFTNRNIVQIFNEDQSQLQATILAINNYRLRPSDKTVLQYWETPSGAPPALRAWFAPGENYGQEFAYPKKMADELARTNNNARVPSYPDTTQVGVGGADKIEVDNVGSGAAPPTPAAVKQLEPPPATPVKPANDILAQQQSGRPSEILLAQNQPPPPSARESSNAAAELPQTATSLGWVLAIGIVLLSGAAALRYARSA